MTAHELARKLLEGPDLQVWFDIMGEMGRDDVEWEGRIEVRQPKWRNTTREDKSRPSAVILVE